MASGATMQRLVGKAHCWLAPLAFFADCFAAETSQAHSGALALYSQRATRQRATRQAASPRTRRIFSPRRDPNSLPRARALISPPLRARSSPLRAVLAHCSSLCPLMLAKQAHFAATRHRFRFKPDARLKQANACLLQELSLI